MEMDLVCIKSGISETSALYHNYSLVKVGALGIIFHMPGAAATTLLYCDPLSNVETWPTTFTETVLTFDFSSCNAVYPPTNCGPQAATAPPIFCGSYAGTQAGVILRQARDDPTTYPYYTELPTDPLIPPNAWYEEYPPIWGWFTNEYFMKF